MRKARDCILFLMISVLPHLLYAQSINIESSFTFNTAVTGETPFWLEHNRHDLIPGSTGALLGFYNRGNYLLSEGLDINWGAEVYARTDRSFLSRPIHQAFAGISYHNWSFHVGLKEERIGIVNSNLSAGPTIWSGNSRPMPKVKIELTDFTAVPLTDKWISVKGGFAHGWFEEDRVISNPLLHEKFAYLSIGKSPYPRAYMGIIHMAQWGGHDPAGEWKLPADWNNYVRLVLGKEGNESSDQMDQNNAIGNHLGSWQAGIMYSFGSTEILLNKSTIFEDGSGLKLWSPEDGLWGINVKHDHNSSSSTEFTWEFWHTKSQSGAGPGNRPSGWDGHPLYDEHGNRFGGRDNYFNHGTYLNGWSYHGRTIGVPFITYDPDSGRMFNNRLIAHHIGFMHSRAEWFIKLLYSWTKNYGAYELRYESPFEEALEQHYSMVSVGRDFSEVLDIPLSVTAEFGLDRGGFSGNRIGLLFSVAYMLK